ncbi:helix-turn-helix domain-containing protein, partial [Micromonospora sp. NPDC052213]|uniref:helix-turn-helix domain-containing protein n=1 Tax=Micromonospora sp. NPDC052213 TaxID=3155812 RepID=UPI00341C87B4
ARPVVVSPNGGEDEVDHPTGGVRRSRHLFGYGPKTLARILRMGRALALARAGTPLAEVAARCGYADQAHLTRDVRDLAGVPPTVLLSR